MHSNDSIISQTRVGLKERNEMNRIGGGKGHNRNRREENGKGIRKKNEVQMKLERECEINK
jgi:hypothetical protein